MPSLTDLRGEPPPGYERAVAFASGDNQGPRGWFIERHTEFKPTLLIFGTVYDVEAAGEWEACARARAQFADELSRHRLPLPNDSLHAEVTGWGGLRRRDR